MPSEAHYQGKLCFLQGQDLHNLKNVDFRSDIKRDIYSFLVILTSFYTGKQMKGYKVLESYKYFISGFVTEVKLKSREIEF